MIPPRLARDWTALHPVVDPEMILSFRSGRAVVIGDVMLDRYVSGHVERISPEAPIPIVSAYGDRSVPGGAANVAAILAALGVDATLVGRWGDDAAGSELRRHLEGAGVLVQPVHEEGIATTEKIRVVSGGQQIVRIDREVVLPLRAEGVARALDALAVTVGSGDRTVIVLSDYAKGMVTADLAGRVIAFARERGIPVIVDPKSDDITKYRGATLVKPNAGEAARMARVAASRTPLELVEEAGPSLRADADLSALVVSLSEHGVAVVTDSGVTTLPSHARAVADVSGAGDAMIAGIAAATSVGATLLDAVELGNVAAGIACGRPGTAIVSAADLLDAALGVSDSGDRPRVSPDWARLAGLLDIERRAGRRIVFANGVFDLLHAGHVRLLREARRFGDLLVVGINSDVSTSRLKGAGRPLQPESDRMAVLDAVRFVDYVTVFEEDTPLELIKALRPDVIVKGSDYTADAVVGAAEAVEWGGEVRIVNLLDGVSTTRLSQGERVRRA